MDYINYNDKKYPSKVINMPFGLRRISSIELNESLMTQNGAYSSNEARLIDEEIFYFVQEEHLLRSSENNLIKIILSEL